MRAAGIGRLRSEKELRVQKLVTIYLDSHAYMGDKWLKGTHADRHAFVEQYLQEDLENGWTIATLHGFGGAADNMNVRGWLAIVLEKQ
jgi:hypothetical protein